MKIYRFAMTVILLILSPVTFALTSAECRSAWKSSSAYHTCSPIWGADKVINGKCGLYVHCKAPNGKEIQNGYITEGQSNYESHYGVKLEDDPHGNRDPRGELRSSGRSLLFSVDEVKKLSNCNGYLKIGPG